MSPLLRSAETAGILGLRRKRQPDRLTKENFFEEVNTVRKLFSQLINNEEPNRVVVVPSASYALANVAQNLPVNKRKEVLLLEDQFPSNYYIWERVAEERGLKIIIVKRSKNKKKDWSTKILDLISDRTLCVSMPIIHWGDGTRFDISAISKKARKYGVLLVVDGTQSIGVLPYNQQKIRADALIVSSYKWLLGPYNNGVAYYGSAFDGGKPIEESWLNRKNSDNFQFLTNYQKKYRPGARRYEVGEAPDFIKMPMLIESLQQIIQWQPEKIQTYCRSIVQPIIQPLLEADFRISHENMAHHLFGITPGKGYQLDKIKGRLAQEKISVSYRGKAIRVSPYIYNTPEDLYKLKDVLMGTPKIS